MTNRMYTSLRGVKVLYDDLLNKATKYNKAPPKSEVVRKAQAVAEERRMNGFIPPQEEPAPPLEHTTAKVVAKDEAKKTPKVAETEA